MPNHLLKDDLCAANWRMFSNPRRLKLQVLEWMPIIFRNGLALTIEEHCSLTLGDWSCRFSSRCQLSSEMIWFWQLKVYCFLTLWCVAWFDFMMQREREEERSRNHPPVSLAATQFVDVEADQAAYEFTFVNDYGTCTGANKNHEHPHWQN